MNAKLGVKLRDCGCLEAGQKLADSLCDVPWQKTESAAEEGGRVRIRQPVYGGSWKTDEGAELPFVVQGEEIDGGLLAEASPDRREPGCVHFGACGGCNYQHGVYQAQVEWKREILSQLMSGARLRVPEIGLESGAEWGYRNRIRLRVQRGAGGDCVVGYSVRGSHEFLPVRMCPIAAPVLWRAAEAMADAARRDTRLSAWLATLAEVELFCTGDETRLQLVFFVRDVDAAKRMAAEFWRVCDGLRARIPELAGSAAEVDPEMGRGVRRRWQGVSWGAAGLNYEAAGRRYWLPRGGFFQVNRFLVDRLVELVAGEETGELAWDLYAGVGLFSRALAERFKHVVAVEGAATTAASLEAGAKATGNTEAVGQATLDFLKVREMQRERPELVVLDPPRAGLGVEGAAILARLSPARIVYVSCDPVTLVRDLEVLCETYTLDRVTMIDLFPQTFHIETVVHLSR